MKEKVISLGKALVEELGLESGVDTLSRWMAHHVAEQITTIENATGEEKSKAEQLCFETVLKLWEHRSVMPDGHRPFENFEAVFRALERLDPECERPFYFRSMDVQDSKANNKENNEIDEVQPWINIALNIDRAARVLIAIAFKNAVKNTYDEKTKSYLKNATNLLKNDEISFLLNFISVDKVESEEDKLEQLKKEQEKEIRLKIEKLDAFIKTSDSIRAALIDELENLPNEKDETNSPGDDIKEEYY